MPLLTRQVDAFAFDYNLQGAVRMLASIPADRYILAVDNDIVAAACDKGDRGSFRCHEAYSAKANCTTVDKLIDVRPSANWDIVGYQADKDFNIITGCECKSIIMSKIRLADYKADVII